MNNFRRRQVRLDAFDYLILVLCAIVLILSLVVNPHDSEDVETEQTEEEAEEVVYEVVAPEIVVTALSCDISNVAVVIEEDATMSCDIPVTYEKLYTDADAVALAQTCYGESRGVPELISAYGVISNKCQQAAVMWSVLNRYDDGPSGYFAKSNTIVGVVAAPGQYHGYSPDNPVTEELLDLAYDVLDRWNREKHGETNVGRVLPADYMWFHGDGRYNHFRNQYGSRIMWDWSLGDPYIY